MHWNLFDASIDESVHASELTNESRSRIFLSLRRDPASFYLYTPALVGVADAPVAVFIGVAHHAPAVVCVADIIATATFIVRGTGGEAKVVVAGAIAAPATALIIRGAVSGWSTPWSSWAFLSPWTWTVAWAISWSTLVPSWSTWASATS